MLDPPRAFLLSKEVGCPDEYSSANDSAESTKDLQSRIIMTALLDQNCTRNREPGKRAATF